MNIDTAYEEFRQKFPVITQAADQRYIKIWGSMENVSQFVWFEYLASAINDRMGNAEQLQELSQIFRYFEDCLKAYDKEMKNCIDVSLVENLFWQVPQSSAEAVWAIFPSGLKRLYMNFHGHEPD